MTVSLKEQYDRQGFVIVDGLVDAKSRPALEAACERAIGQTRAGQWPHRRVVGKQFPPYGDANPDSWGVQHVMHPDLDEPAFAEWYTSDALINVVQELLACKDEDLQMELFNLLINPEAHSFALRWHRDDVSEQATEEEERKALAIWHHGVQWNTALYEDDCLFIVPGSHLVPRTPKQRAHSSTLSPPDNPLDMSGVMRVKLQPGQTVFYNNNILHCATYDSKKRRATLHASMGDVSGGSTRARNVLQHGLRWMKEDRFASTLNPKGRKMLNRLIQLQEAAGGDVGYSLKD